MGKGAARGMEVPAQFKCLPMLAVTIARIDKFLCEFSILAGVNTTLINFCSIAILLEVIENISNLKLF